MSIDFIRPEVDELRPRISVIGVGGAGGNAVAQMFAGPRASGTWVGVQNAIGNLSGIIGPIITGIVVQRAGYNSAFVLTAAIAAVGAMWGAIGVPKIEQVDLDEEHRAN